MSIVGRGPTEHQTARLGSRLEARFNEVQLPDGEKIAT